MTSDADQLCFNRSTSDSCGTYRTRCSSKRSAGALLANCLPLPLEVHAHATARMNDIGGLLLRGFLLQGDDAGLVRARTNDIQAGSGRGGALHCGGWCSPHGPAGPLIALHRPAGKNCDPKDGTAWDLLWPRGPPQFLLRFTFAFEVVRRFHHLLILPGATICV